MLMSSRVTVLTFLLAALVATTGCSRRDETEPCVATPSFTLGRDRAAIGSPLKLTYGFEMAQNAKIDQDYWVFVHVLDSEGESLWGDDHQPPEPTSKWQPGKRIEYTRTVFVPSYPYIGPAQVRIGLYQPSSGRRLVLCAADIGRREYRGRQVSAPAAVRERVPDL